MKFSPIFRSIHKLIKNNLTTGEENSVLRSKLVDNY